MIPPKMTAALGRLAVLESLHCLRCSGRAVSVLSGLFGDALAAGLSLPCHHSRLLGSRRGCGPFVGEAQRVVPPSGMTLAGIHVWLAELRVQFGVE